MISTTYVKPKRMHKLTKYKRIKHMIHIRTRFNHVQIPCEGLELSLLLLNAHT